MSWYFDLHPRTAPFSGALVERLEPAAGGLQKAEYRAEANGAGVGIIGLRGDGAYGQLLDPEGLQYVKVRRTDTLAVDGGFFLEKGDFAALTEQRSRYLEFSGAGPLSYLDREVMWRYTYETWGNDPEEGGVDTWQLWAQSSIYAGGDYLGAVLWRVLHEALGYVNAPGYVARTPHEDDKLETAIPGVTLTFDGFEDSGGNAWTLPSGEFTAQVGESIYAVVQRLMRAGLYVEMDPDTGAVSAWEAATHRMDRTGASYGADVVRFVGGENIKSDAKRTIAAFMRRTAVLAYGQNMGSMATGAGDVPWHGAVYSDVKDDAALEQLAASEIAHRADVGDVLRLRMLLGNAPLAGAYMPFEHIKPDMVVTVHTGATQWDFDNASFPVAALEIKLRPAGDWDAFAHLGAVYMDAATRAFQAAPLPHHSHPHWELCPATVPGSGTTSIFGAPLTWSEPQNLTVTAFEQTIPALTVDGSLQAAHAISNGYNHDQPFWRNPPGGARVPDAGKFFPCSAGVPITVEMDVRYQASPGNNASVAAVWYGTGLAASIGATDVLPLQALGGWVHLSETITPPTGAVAFTLSGIGAYDNIDILGGTATEEQNPYAGTSVMVARCDHVHPPSSHVHDDLATEEALLDHAADTDLHAAAGSHPDLSTHDSLGLATDAELAAHAADTGLHGGGGGAAAWAGPDPATATAVTPTGTVTWTKSADKLSAKFATQTANDVAALLIPIAGVTRVALKGTWMGNQNYAMWGIVFSDGTVATSTGIFLQVTAPIVNANNFHFRQGTLTNLATNSALVNLATRIVAPMYMRMTLVSANTWRTEYSADGVQWHSPIADVAFTLTPTHIGVGVSTFGGASSSLATFSEWDVT